ncbi:S24 family peptidase [Hirschia litorea]|uniref:Helix-turn-helix transcriptional regulator n=1 Tax=Hirschia litorea TaxID=1199156 RepID=A0ABW2IM32_9PROT
MRHSDIWNGIDALAARHNLSVSALARAAGLDPTAFNKSKRASPDGAKPRWPSTESLSKALAAVGTGWQEFADMAQGLQGRTIPLIGLAQAGHGGFFDDAGFPVGAGWDDIHFPDMGDETVYALEISGDSMEPVFREGDRIIVAPGMDVRRGDRVVAKTKSGEVLAKLLGRKTANRVELISCNPAYPPREIDMASIDWIARIVWASQ